MVKYAKTSNGEYLQVFKPTIIGGQNKPFYQFADTVGDGSGSVSQNVDGSITPQVFYIKPNAGEIILLSRVIISIRDDGIMDSGGWGNNGGVPLTNGVDMVYHSNGADINILNLKSHFDIAAVCYDVSRSNYGSGDEFVIARWTFSKTGQYIRLVGDDGDYVSVTINDNLTYLVNQVMHFQGFYEKTN